MLISYEAALHVFSVCASVVCLDYTLILVSQGRGEDISKNKLNWQNKSALSDSHKKTIPARRVFALAESDCGSKWSLSVSSRF